MERKAQENLEAALVLLSQENPFPNAACSRAYYAAYQACWVAMVDAGVTVPADDGKAYFRHKDLPSQAREREVLTQDQQEDLEHLEATRINADYREDELTLEDARTIVALAEVLVPVLLKVRH